MRINDELSKPVLVHAAKVDWVASPSAGVDRRMLFRIGGEVARATSTVRHAPGSVFPRHTHSGGEEIVVLEGYLSGRAWRLPRRHLFPQSTGDVACPGLERWLHNFRQAVAIP